MALPRGVLEGLLQGRMPRHRPRTFRAVGVPQGPAAHAQSLERVQSASRVMPA